MQPIDDLVLEQMLHERGLVGAARIERAKGEASRTGKTLQEVLLAHKLISPDEFTGLGTEHTIRTVHWDSPVAGVTGKPPAPPHPEENMPPEALEMAKRPEYCFDKFILLGLLGRGGAGEVWKAWQRDLRRYVAIKFLESRTGVDLDRFLREAQTAASLTHPNITALYELNRHGERQYIVMQFIDGVTLHANAGKIAERRACELVREAALAFDHAHRQGIIHRDIKPQNIMVDRDGHVFVMDFGLAKQSTDTSGATVAGQILGTPAYMSPEQAESRFHKMDRRSDVYSLGATFYSLLTGKFPVEGATAMDRIQAVIAGEIVPPRKHNARISPEVEGIVLKAMEHDPELRYQSAAAMAEDLRRFLDGEPVTATGPTIGKALRYTFLRHRTAILSVGVVILLAVVALVTYNAARAGVDPSELARREAELTRREQGDLARDRLDRVRSMWTELQRLIVLDGESWARLTGQAEILAAQAEDLHKAHPDLAEAAMLIARGRAVRQEWAAAERAYQGAIQADPANEPAYLELAHVYQVWGQEADLQADWTAQRATAEGDAIRSRTTRLMTDYLKLARDPIGRMMAEAYLLFVDGQWAKCADVAKRAVEDADHQTPPRALWEGLWLAAKAFRRAGRHYDAWSPAELAARQQRNNPAALHLAAACHWEMWAAPYEHRKNAALHRIDHLMRLKPTDAATLLRGSIRILEEQWDGVEEDAALAAKEKPKSPNPHLLRAQAAIARQKYTEAEKAANTAIKLDQRCARAYHLRGLAALRNADLESAAEDFDRALTIDPAMAEARADRAELYYKQGRRADGDRDIAEAARLDLGFASLHIKTFIDQQRWPDAVVEGRRYLELSPHDYISHWYTGWAQVRAQNYAEGLQTLNTADRLLPNASRILFWRAAAYAGLKQYNEALADFTQVVAINPDDADAWSRRAYVLEGLKRYKDAIASMRRAIEEGEKSKVPRILAMLPQLRAEAEDAIAEWERRIQP